MKKANTETAIPCSNSFCYKELFEGAPFGFIVLDENFSIRYLNKAAGACLGITNEIGSHGYLVDYIDSKCIKEIYAAHEQIRKSGSGAPLAITVKKGAQTVLEIQAVLYPIINLKDRMMKGSCLAFTQTMPSISDQQFKYEVLSGISHHVRTPLNAIMGMAHLLAETALNQEQQTYLCYLRTASARLLGYLNENVR
jgi:nitrogen-specific signal transduction histidine kinase